MFARRLLMASVFLYFVEDSGSAYGHAWFAPMGWLHDIFFFELPYKIRILDHILLLCLLLGLAKGGRAPRAAPMRNALFVEGATIALWFIYGVASGGDPRYASWQTYLVMGGVLLSFAMGTVCQTARHFATLGKVLLAAAAYRAIMCWLFYFLFVRSHALEPPPAYMTEHDDTVLWIVSIILLIIYIVDTPSLRKRVPAGLFAIFLLGAVEFNGRRLAWVSLAMGFVVVFLLLPAGRAKRTIIRACLVATPILLIYVAVGWGRHE